MEPGDPDDDAEEANLRLNRELDQLLSELRVALPGVQVLLAFLLTVAFTSTFDGVDTDGRVVYLASVLFAALATIVLVAPSFHHRVRFRDGTKEQMIKVANVLAIAGAVLLGLAIGCAIYVLGDTAFSQTPARWLGPGLVLVAGLLWFVLPLGFRGGQTPHPDRRSAPPAR